MNPSNPPIRRIELFGIAFDALDFTQTLDRLIELARGEGNAYAVTANVDHVVRFHRRPDLRSIYTQADLVTADGAPVIWASRLLGSPLPERVAGSDLFPALCGRAADEGLSVFLLGGDPGAAEGSVEVLTTRYPKLKAGWFCPRHGFDQYADQVQQVIETVRSAQPDILFVALGSPKQEQWIVNHREACGAKLNIGVGISFSFLCDQVRRAPMWMRRTGLEWAHRLFQEPGRLWKRYLVDDALFVPLVARAMIQRLRTRHGRFR